MSILKIARMGHPVLRARARPLHPSEIRTAKIQQLIDDMFETMKEYQGVGLAAPQVHEGLRVFVAGFPPARRGPGDDAVEEDEGDRDADDGEDVPQMALINPELVLGRDVTEDWEGCLSIPDIRGRVLRARQISVRAYDRFGKRFELEATGFTARVIQHETDHLDGILFFDRMKNLQSLTFLDEFGRYWSSHSVKAE